MNITPELVRNVAKNSRLALTEQEVAQYTKDFDNILTAFAQLQQAPVQGVEPSIQPTSVLNVTREDKPEPCLTQEQSLSNTVQLHKFIKGPRLS